MGNVNTMTGIEQAGAEDAGRLLALRDGAARWMLERGIRQWSPGEVTLSEIAEQIRGGEWFVLRDGDAVAGAARVLVADEAVWGTAPARQPLRPRPGCRSSAQR